MKLKAIISLRGGGASVRAGAEFAPADLGMSDADVDVALKRGFVERVQVAPAPAPAPSAPADKTKKVKAKQVMLLGSSILPSLVDIKGEQVQLGVIVSGAHKESGLSVEDWNDLSDDEREVKLADYITALNAPE